MDILALAVFQWTLALALVISSCYENMIPANLDDAFAIGCSEHGEKIRTEYGNLESAKA